MLLYLVAKARLPPPPSPSYTVLLFVLLLAIACCSGRSPTDDQPSNENPAALMEIPMSWEAWFNHLGLEVTPRTRALGELDLDTAAFPASVDLEGLVRVLQPNLPAWLHTPQPLQQRFMQILLADAELNRPLYLRDILPRLLNGGTPAELTHQSLQMLDAVRNVAGSTAHDFDPDQYPLISKELWLLRNILPASPGEQPDNQRARQIIAELITSTSRPNTAQVAHLIDRILAGQPAVGDDYLFAALLRGLLLIGSNVDDQLIAASKHTVPALLVGLALRYDRSIYVVRNQFGTETE